ncbi:MAG: hypothetical protein MJE77_22110 [Proteobacteria bacterium]|nr:hypothetical protein [Pseudomonadota bacterium]
MPLIKHRPRIRLMLIPELKPGETFVATVVIEARREVAVEYIDVDFEGIEERSIGSGQYKLVRRSDICYLRARITLESPLAEGRSEYRCRFSLPASAPPTYSGDRIRISYLMNVRISIPWWPDARASFEVNVGAREREPALKSRPILFSSQPEGPSANEPHIEGSLSGDLLPAGGLISGAVALSNVDYARYTGLRLSLIGLEWIQIGARQSESEAHRYEIFLPLDEPKEGKPYQFRMRLPAHVPVTHRDQDWHLLWFFECKAHIRWAQDIVLRLPVTVVPRRERTTTLRSRHAPPAVGSERIKSLWRHVADSYQLRFDGRRIHGLIAQADVSVEREHRGSDGVFLVGSLGYSPLHIGLAIEPASGWLKMGERGIELGHRKWDARHRVTSRDHSQLRAIAGSLRDPLASFDAVRMNDDTAVVELRNAGASKSRLDAFVGDLAALARSMAELRGHIPPPGAMRDFVGSWGELAKKLDGTLEKANISITGSIGGMAVSVRTEWTPEGDPLHTLVELRPPMIIADSHRGRVAVEQGQSVAEALGGAAPVSGRALEGAWSVDIAAEHIRVTLPAPIRDAAVLLPQLRAMSEWARQLSSVSGPYR